MSAPPTTPSRGIRLVAIAHDCHECTRHRISLRRLEALTRRRAHAALAGRPHRPVRPRHASPGGGTDPLRRPPQGRPRRGGRRVKAITVRNPYAWAIATGRKDVENRTRTTSHRGDIAIHGGTAWHKAGSTDRRVIDAWWGSPDNGITRLDASDFAGAWFGRVLAVAELYDCHSAASGCCPSKWGDPDGFHLMLRNVRRLNPLVPAKGVLGLWNLPDDIAEQVRAQIEVAA